MESMRQAHMNTIIKKKMSDKGWEANFGETDSALVYN